MPASLPPGPLQPKALQTLAWWFRPAGYMERCRRRFGKRFTLRVFEFDRVVVLADADEVKELFTAPVDIVHPGEGAQILAGVLGPNSLLRLDGNEHLRQRRLLLPPFHGEMLDRLRAMMEEIAEREIAEWPVDEPTTLLPRLQRLTLEVILRTVFGLEQGPETTKLRNGLVEALDANANLLALLSRTRRSFGGIGPWARFEAAQRENDRLIRELIATRRRQRSERDDVLSMLLAARYEDGAEVSDGQLHDQLITLLTAGYETSAATLAWTFEHLSHAPQEVLERLTDEIDHDGGDEYTTAVLQEVMRCHPVSPCIPRRVKREVQIGEWTYPGGALLLAEQNLIHHDPAIYPQPFCFRPERFLEEPPGTYTWIPFGGGMRRCIGASFAMLEMKTVVRAVVRARRLRAAADAPDSGRRRSTVFVPRNGGRVVLARRPGLAAV